MAPQDIRRQLNAKPFKPFRLYVTDGSNYDVGDPSIAYVDLTPQVVVGINFDEETGLPLKSACLAPNHVTRIVPLDDVEATGGNGTGGHR